MPCRPRPTPRTVRLSKAGLKLLTQCTTSPKVNQDLQHVVFGDRVAWASNGHLITCVRDAGEPMPDFSGPLYPVLAASLNNVLRRALKWSSEVWVDTETNIATVWRGRADQGDHGADVPLTTGELGQHYPFDQVVPGVRGMVADAHNMAAFKAGLLGQLLVGYSRLRPAKTDPVMPRLHYPQNMLDPLRVDYVDQEMGQEWVSAVMPCKVPGLTQDSAR